MHKRALIAARIERGRDQKDIVQRRRGFREAEDLVILSRVEPEVVEPAQGAVAGTNGVQLCEVILDVPRRVPVTAFELVFLGIKILLLAGHGRVFT